MSSMQQTIKSLRNTTASREGLANITLSFEGINKVS